ncbi:MAG: hypothetical protein JNK90_17760 [Planctomycetaceae bacterium]|nr:hypothetical protein [Planctomycetaceae bacterium]
MKYEIAGIRFPYSIADTFSGPVIRLPDNGTMELEYRNYREEQVSLVFHGVLGIKYQSVVCNESGWAEDQAIAVIDSEWLRNTCVADNLDPRDFRHLIIGFNERQMVLEVLFRNIEETNNPMDRSGGSAAS